MSLDAEKKSRDPRHDPATMGRFMFPNGLGLTRLGRFEKVDLVGMLVLFMIEKKNRNVTHQEAEEMIHQGKCDLLLRRNYSNGRFCVFKVKEHCMLELVHDSHNSPA